MLSLLILSELEHQSFTYKHWFNHIRRIYSNVDTFECMMINHAVNSTDERTTKDRDSVVGAIRDRLFYDMKSDTN